MYHKPHDMHAPTYIPSLGGYLPSLGRVHFPLRRVPTLLGEGTYPHLGYHLNPSMLGLAQGQGGYIPSSRRVLSTRFSLYTLRACHTHPSCMSCTFNMLALGIPMSWTSPMSWTPPCPRHPPCPGHPPLAKTPPHVLDICCGHTLMS